MEIFVSLKNDALPFWLFIAWPWLLMSWLFFVGRDVLPKWVLNVIAVVGILAQLLWLYVVGNVIAGRL